MIFSSMMARDRVKIIVIQGVLISGSHKTFLMFVIRFYGAPKPGKRARGAAGKAKVVVVVETPGNKPRFAVMHMGPRVSGQEIQAMVRARLVTEVVVKPTVGKGIASWMPCSTVMSGSFPVQGKRRRRSCLGSTP
jgi:hypothetical protein